MARSHPPAARGIIGQESSGAVLAEQLVVLRPDSDGGEAVQSVVLHKSNVTLVLQEENENYLCKNI